MATRTIVTSQPDVACEVCERRLLRGEQPDVFLAAGRRRIVCELCAPRAAHEGWLRETDGQSVSLPPLRPRRGRSLFDRLPVPFRVRQVGAKGAPRGAQAGGPTPAAAAVDGSEHPGGSTQESYELLGGYARAGAEPVAGTRGAATATGQGPLQRDASALDGEGLPEQDAGLGELEPTAGEAPEAPSPYVEQAIAVFNASEFPRRVAGVARSLGAPEVNIRSAEHLDSVVSIVVAWELCWYRYEVDLSEPVAEAQAIAQGTELSELAREDRIANAAASESGTLLLAAL
jgi:hypothetical protein